MKLYLNMKPLLFECRRYNLEELMRQETGLNFLITSILIVGLAQANTLTVSQNGHNYSSIQVAIDSANSGDIIEVYNGTYYENVNIKKQVTLKGINIPVIDAGYNGSAITLSANGITIEGFKVINSMGNETAGGIQVASSGNTIRNNEANNSHIGISLMGARGNSIINNTMNNNDYVGLAAFFLSNNNNVSNNTAINNGQTGILIYQSANNKITGNTAKSNEVHGIYLVFSKNNIIENNKVSDCKIGICQSGSGNIIENNDLSNIKSRV